MPGAGMGGPVDQGADHFLPIEALGDVVALEIVSAGKAQKRRVHGSHFFHKVDAVAVDAIVVGGREEGYKIEPESAGMADGDSKMVGGGWLDCSGFEREFVLLPIR